MPIEIAIEPEYLFNVLTIPVSNTFLSTLIVVSIILLYCLISVVFFTPKGSGLNQQIIETVVESMYEFIERILGAENTKKYFGLLFSFFIFILISNWFGLLPTTSTLKYFPMGAEHQVHLFKAPTSDINTTLALAIISVVFIQSAGIKHLGIKTHLSKYFNYKKSKPGVMGAFEAGIKSFASFLEFISEFTKIISFSFRLFGNIFAGEVLLTVITVLSFGIATLPFLGLEFFVGFIQAFVFMMLTVIFLNLNIKAHH